jgi:hypothetical protein
LPVTQIPSLLHVTLHERLRKTCLPCCARLQLTTALCVLLQALPAQESTELVPQLMRQTNRTGYLSSVRVTAQFYFFYFRTVTAYYLLDDHVSIPGIYRLWSSSCPYPKDTRDKTAGGVKLTSQPQLQPRSKKRGAITPPPHTS